MIITGVDFHLQFQQIASVDTHTGQNWVVVQYEGCKILHTQISN
jgi:hypothetical protein